ncbi:MAG: pseudouridine synthase [Pseudomonadota bacterium]|nr:pseudouridine synthase [Pseudomonadota bacterium]
MADRIQKVLANAGVASRREVERWIRQGRLVVGDKPAQLGDQLDGDERVFLDGRLLRIRSSSECAVECIAYYKPSGEITSRKDPEKRPTIFERLKPPRHGRWISVGRLDINTSGLLILATDGKLAHRLMHPSYEISREYAVRVLGRISRQQMKRLQDGVELEDGLARFDSIVANGGTGANAWYSVTLHEGRNREIRRLFESLEIPVSRLLRTRFGPIALADMRRGTTRVLGIQELKQLYNSVDLSLNHS